MLPNLAELKQSMRESVLETYSNEYKDLADTWRGLESKAQAVITVAGIFIAGAFSYVNKIGSQSTLTERVFLGVAVSCLVVSVVLSILALRLRTVAAPLMGDAVNQFVGDMLTVTNEQEFVDRLPDFYRDQVRIWRSIKEQTYAANQSKALYVLWAQIALVVAIASVACITMIKVFW